MLNKKMFKRLYRSLIESGDASLQRLTLYDVRRKAMVLKTSISLTRGEEEACEEVEKEADFY